jgi:hypothetical protein
VKQNTRQTSKQIIHVIYVKKLTEEKIKLDFQETNFSWQLLKPNGEVFEGHHQLAGKIDPSACNHSFLFSFFLSEDYKVPNLM